MDSARHEFEALIKEKLGSEVAESIDWRNPRMVCIAAGFSHHDRVAVHRLGERIDLVRYRVFEGGLLSLLLIESTPGSTRPISDRRQNREREVTAGAAGKDGKTSAQATATAGAIPGCLQNLYAELDEALTAWGEVEVAQLRHYIAYRRMVNVASVIFRPKHEAILVYLKIDPDTVELEEGFSRDMRGIGHLGTDDLEVRIATVSHRVVQPTLLVIFTWRSAAIMSICVIVPNLQADVPSVRRRLREARIPVVNWAIASLIGWTADPAGVRGGLTQQEGRLVPRFLDAPAGLSRLRSVGPGPVALILMPPVLPGRSRPGSAPLGAFAQRRRRNARTARPPRTAGPRARRRRLWSRCR